MVSVTYFKSSSIQHDVHFVNYGPVYFKIDNKAGSLQWQPVSSLLSDVERLATICWQHKPKL